MKCSELISLLQSMQAAHGDAEVTMFVTRYQEDESIELPVGSAQFIKEEGKFILWEKES